MNSYDNPNGSFIPGQYNPQRQTYNEGDLAAMYGIQDPTQIPRIPGDTERPMHRPEPISVDSVRQMFQQQPRFDNAQQPQPQPAQQPQFDMGVLMQMMQVLMQQQQQSAASSSALRSQPISQPTPQPQVQVSPQPINPTVIPVVLELTINLKLNIQAQEA